MLFVLFMLLMLLVLFMWFMFPMLGLADHCRGGSDRRVRVSLIGWRVLALASCKHCTNPDDPLFHTVSFSSLRRPLKASFQPSPSCGLEVRTQEDKRLHPAPGPRDTMVESSVFSHPSHRSPILQSRFLRCQAPSLRLSLPPLTPPSSSSNSSATQTKIKMATCGR